MSLSVASSKDLPEVIEFVEYQISNKEGVIIGMGITYFGNPIEVVCETFDKMYPNGHKFNCFLSHLLVEFNLTKEEI